MKHRQGYTIPLSLLVAGVTLVLGLSAARMTAGDLQAASHEYHRERARQMAEYGLELAATRPIPPGANLPWTSLSRTHPEDRVKLTVFQPGDAGCPVAIPPGHQYWIAEGTAGQGSRRLASARIGALVRFGRPLGSAGAQVRFASFHAANNDPVSFRVVDGRTQQEVPDEVVVSSEATNMPGTPPPGAPFLTTPVSLGPVLLFRGKVQIPQGAPESLVSYQAPPGAQVAVEQNGGPLNVPEYSPPSGLTYATGQSISGPVQLPPGRYGTLTLTPQARVELNGTYHFERVVLDGLSTSQAARWVVPSQGQTRVFVDQITQNQALLEIENQQHVAGDFRLTFRQVAAETTPPIALKLIHGGEASVVAQGRHLKLVSDGERRIKGAFCCGLLSAEFPPGNHPNPQFIYDISGSTARRPRGPAPGGGAIDDAVPANPPTPIPDPGDGETTSSDGDGDGNSGSYSNPNPNPTPITHPPESGAGGHPAGLEPIILSRQNL
jgi:hypothetical protein